MSADETAAQASPGEANAADETILQPGRAQSGAVEAGAAAQVAATQSAAAQSAADGGASFAEAEQPTETRTEVEVGVVRSVRYGRLIVGGAVVCAVIAMLAALAIPVADDAEYSMGQVVGFVAVFGGAIGVGLGAILALLLARAAKRTRGSATAVLTDVR